MISKGDQCAGRGEKISSSLNCLQVVPLGEGISEGVIHKLRAKARALYETGGVRTVLIGSGTPPRLMQFEDWMPRENNFWDSLELLARRRPDTTFFMQYKLVGRPLVKFMIQNPNRIVFEHNTIDSVELKFRCQNLSWRDLLYILRTDPRRLIAEYLMPYVNELLYGVKAVRLSRASVCVCRAVEEHILQAHPQQRTLVLGNGIDISAISVRCSHPTLERSLRMFFVCGSPSTWTGDDRLLKSLIEYCGETTFELHCVGRFAPQIQRLAQKIAAPHSVHFHGLKSRNEILEMASSMHLGVGSLGLHRLNLWDASTLKVREYMAMGLPFFTSHQDVDASPGYPYSHTFPAGEALLDLDQLPLFLERLYREDFHPSKMRAESLPLIDMRSKTTRLVEFMRDL